MFFVFFNLPYFLFFILRFFFYHYFYLEMSIGKDRNFSQSQMLTKVRLSSWKSLSNPTSHLMTLLEAYFKNKKKINKKNKKKITQNTSLLFVKKKLKKSSNLIVRGLLETLCEQMLGCWFGFFFAEFRDL